MYKIFVDSCFFAVSIFFSNYSIAGFILVIRFFIFCITIRTLAVIVKNVGAGIRVGIFGNTANAEGIRSEWSMPVYAAVPAPFS